MSFLLLTIATSITLYVITKSFLYLFLISIGVYYLIRRNSKLENFLSLTFVLMIALALFSKLKGYDPKGLNMFFYASFTSILYDLFKKFYWSIPFFGLLGIGISLVGSIKYSTWGYLFGFLIIPIFLREFKKRGNNVENLDSSSRSRKEDEI
ncbi:MAG: hypothetical protein J7J43_01445 [Thermosipho sp. (in: Bacteria)]|nr:hypothetical protein [Thermosipho sp. (in: thermotogales)]